MIAIQPCRKRPLRHVAQFTLIGLYTGTRAGAIATASPFRAEGKSFVDLESGFSTARRLASRQAPNVSRPCSARHASCPSSTMKAPRHCTDALREWNGKSVALVKTGFASGVRFAGLDVGAGNVTRAYARVRRGVT